MNLELRLLRLLAVTVLILVVKIILFHPSDFHFEWW